MVIEKQAYQNVVEDKLAKLMKLVPASKELATKLMKNKKLLAASRAELVSLTKEKDLRESKKA